MLSLSCDFDGLLVDTEHPLAVRVAEIATRAGFAIDAETVFAYYASGKARVKFTGIADMLHKSLPNEVLDAMLRQHHEAVTEIYLGTSFAVAFRGAAPALQVIQSRSHRLWVCSNSKPSHISESLAVAGLSGYFNDRIYTSDDVEGRKKPDPAMLFHAMRANNANVRTTIHIGDALIDAQASTNAGIRSIIFVDPRHNGHSAEHTANARAAGASHVFSDFAELPELVELCVTELQYS